MAEIFDVVLYLRVSTKLQEVENQRLDLMNFATARGWKIVKEYVDIGVSGAKARRPGLDKLMADAHKRRFSAVLVARFDRMARSVKHLVDVLHEFRELGIRFISFHENIDLGTPMGEAMFAIIAALAQLERDIICERIKAGLRRVIAEGRKLGRPAREMDLPKALKLRASGMNLRQIAAELGLSKSRIAAAIKNAGDPQQTNLEAAKVHPQDGSARNTESPEEFLDNTTDPKIIPVPCDAVQTKSSLADSSGSAASPKPIGPSS